MGAGGNLMDAVLAIEQIALICPRSADVIQAGGTEYGLAEYATDYQKKIFKKIVKRRNGNWFGYD